VALASPKSVRVVCLALAGIFATSSNLRWVREGNPTAQALAVVHVLQSAAEQGLDPDDYDGRLWDERLAALYSPDGQRAFDQALTAAAERYVLDLAHGRVDPREAGDALGRGARLDARAFVRKLSRRADVEFALREIETPLSAYRPTVVALRRYLDLASRDPGPPLEAPGIVKPGERWSDAGRLAERLSLLGDLRAPHQAADLYEGALVEAVRRFQGRHGLGQDGRVGPLTLQALNVPLSRRVIQLRLAIERLRWLPRRYPAPPIVVNIPEYRLRFDGAQGPLSMKVVVGEAYEHRTPVFASTLERIVFRPRWNVPASIERDDLAEEFERDPAAMTRLGFEAVDASGRVVEPSRAIPRLRTGELRLRQAPGPRNALGLVKFDLPNRFGVYLHGTPGRALFERTRRDFSHGCIRVESAEALAAGVLGWTRERVRAAMLGKETLVVVPKVRFPVLILYSTAVVREDGSVRFLEDVYGKDAELESALERSHAQPFRASARRAPQDSHVSGAALGLH
jgi:murein L,D-transpeptidase YcbB/YkuD